MEPWPIPSKKKKVPRGILISRARWEQVDKAAKRGKSAQYKLWEPGEEGVRTFLSCQGSGGGEKDAGWERAGGLRTRELGLREGAQARWT